MRITLALALLTCLSSCSFSCVEGEGEVMTREIDLDLIHSIQIESSADVELSFDLNQQIEVTGQSNIIDLLDRTIDDGVWRIDFTENVCFDKDFLIKISLPKLESIDINGSGSVKTRTPFHAGEFDIEISGSGDILLDINTEELNTSIRGSGDVEILGFAEEHNISVRGSGNVNAEDLKVKVCDIEIGGSGDCSVYVTEELDISINGSGDVLYDGNPEELTLKVNGSGEAKKK